MTTTPGTEKVTRYEPCVLGSDGRCTRWSHDHSGEAPATENVRSHQRCRDAGEHVCQKPSGRVCIEYGCDLPAGTLWGPVWCPEHDQARLDRISEQMESIFRPGGEH